MTVTFLELLPAFAKKGAIVVEADKEQFRTPAQAVANMKSRGLAARKLLPTVGTKMGFLGQAQATFGAIFNNYRNNS